jgi:glyoxylase-like metal-dependent hydrolase (beta-lactamase superfamily II)
MRQLVISLAAALLAVLAAAVHSATPQQLIDRAIAAAGGEQALSRLNRIALTGVVRLWEPEQSHEPGGSMRYGGLATFTQQRDGPAGLVRTDWVRDYEYPARRSYTYTEIVTPQAGYVKGIDSTARTKQSQANDPPQHAMSGVRLAAAQRELARSAPTLLLAMKANPQALSALPDQRAGGVRLPALAYRWRDQRFVVMFSAQSGLPAAIRILDADAIQGDSTYDLLLTNWREVDGAQLAHGQDYVLNGFTVMQTRITRAAPGAPAADAFAIAADLKAAAPPPAQGPVPYQWVLRRQHLGVYLDSDGIGYDTGTVQGLTLAEIAPGLSLTQGGTHNSMIVEMADHLVVFDAPIGEGQARWTVEAARARYPGKPVRYLVLTHHHMDHASGTRTFVALEGSKLVVGKGARAHFERVLAAPHRVDNDLLQQRPRKTEIIEVDGRWTTSDGRREVAAYEVDNPHAEAMLIGYLPDAKLGFVTDIWSPGRDKLGDKPTPGQAALVAAVQKLGLPVERFAGGHGSTAPYADLARIAGATK